MIFRSIVSIALFSWFTNLHAQQYHFAIGLSYQPFLYQNYNQSDWNNRPESFPLNNRSLNGKAFGITFQTPITELFSLKIDALYSTQEQQHSLLSATIIDPDTHLEEYLYGTNVTTEFKLYKLPIQLSILQEIGTGSGFYIQPFAGPQISYLSTYTSIYSQYAFNDSLQEINFSFLENYIKETPEHFEQTIWENSPIPMYENHSGLTEYLYNKLLFGVIGGVELQKIISDFLVLGLGGNVEYDFTNSEKNQHACYPGMGQCNEDSRAKSHNVGYGLRFTVMYLIY